MIEITLPCCENPARVETLEATIHCDHCGIDLEVAADEAIAVPVAA